MSIFVAFIVALNATHAVLTLALAAKQGTIKGADCGGLFANAGFILWGAVLLVRAG